MELSHDGPPPESTKLMRCIRISCVKSPYAAIRQVRRTRFLIQIKPR